MRDEFRFLTAALDLPPSLFSSLAVSLPTDRIPAGGRFHFIRHRPLQDDLGPGVVGDFHQAGSQGELVAERDERRESRVESRTLDSGLWTLDPFAIDHARNPADRLHLRVQAAMPSGPAAKRTILSPLATCTGLGHRHKEPINSPIPKITVAIRYATGQPEEK